MLGSFEADDQLEGSFQIYRLAEVGGADVVLGYQHVALGDVDKFQTYHLDGPALGASFQPRAGCTTQVENRRGKGGWKDRPERRAGSIHGMKARLCSMVIHDHGTQIPTTIIVRRPSALCRCYSRHSTSWSDCY
jgi:hypothetical protein